MMVMPYALKPNLPNYYTGHSDFLTLKDMATIKKSVLGIFSGKFGNIVGYNLHGVQVIRSVSKKTNKPPTNAQLAQRMCFGLVNHFLSPLKAITSKGYGNKQEGKSPSSQCVAYHTMNAVTGTFPNLEIDYSMVILTTGHLLGVAHGKVCSDEPGCLNFSWADRLNHWKGSSTDDAILVAYNPVKDRHEYKRTSSTRADLCACLDLGRGWSGETFHCWMLFISPDGKEFSTSSYLGTVTVA